MLRNFLTLKNYLYLSSILRLAPGGTIRLKSSMFITVYTSSHRDAEESLDPNSLKFLCNVLCVIRVLIHQPVDRRIQTICLSFRHIARVPRQAKNICVQSCQITLLSKKIFLQLIAKNRAPRMCSLFHMQNVGF